MKNNFKKYGTIQVSFETLEERQRAFEILEARGIRIDDEYKDSASFSHPLYVTHLLDVNIKTKEFFYCPRPFICAAMCSSGVRLYSVTELERIAELNFKVVPRFPVFHIPHDGWEFPPELMTSVCISEETFMAYHEAMRDKQIRDIVPRPYVGMHMLQRFPVSRLLCDVERFTGPEEVMERYGMGFCYEKAFDGEVIKHVTQCLKDETLKYYTKHHDYMNSLCERHPRILLFDLHSYSDRIVPDDFIRDGERLPDLCIGTDPRYTPPRLTEIIRQRFAEAGLSIRENYPYSGCYVPESVFSGASGCDFTGIMLEFNRRAYCDNQDNVLPDRIEMLKAVIRKVMVDCVDLE